LADVQRHLDAFHRSIRWSLDENQTLRQKRDAICRRVEARLPGIFEVAGEECPPFEFRDQGSYKMRTGVVPLDKDYDIDLGLFFEIDPDDYHPVELKRRVHAALEGHTPGNGFHDGVTIRRPCVTVQYHRNGKPVYHVDIAVYADGTLCRDGKPRIAMGKGRSEEKFCEWQISDPLALSSLIIDSRDGEELTQFRRVVRYLKRWKDARFPSRGNGAPLGIALTVAAHQHFSAEFFRDGRPNDLKALVGVVSGILDSFVPRPLAWFLGGPSHKTSVKLPVEPFSDLCGRMTPRHMTRFHKELERLVEVLEAVQGGRSEEKACERMQEVFGTDFPLPVG
jgi:hypothetical protein